MIPHRKMVNTVRLEEYQGESSLGPVYADPVELRALVEEVETLVLDTNGQEVVSNATVYMDARDVPAKSRVTLWPGLGVSRETQVITAATWRKLRLAHTVLRLG